MELRREKMNQINRLQNSRSYNSRDSTIKNQITFEYYRVVVIWSQTGENSRDQIVKTVQAFGKISCIQDRWVVTENGERKWLGVLVEYARANDAKEASLQLPLLIK